MKQCRRCNKHKPISEYHKRSAHHDGLSIECKECAHDRYIQANTVERKKRRYKVKKEWVAKNPKHMWVSYALYRAKRRAKEKNIPFDLNSSQLHGLLTERCPVFGTPFIFAGNGIVTSSSPSIDRIDPKKGYVLENVVIISVKANTIKNAYTSEDLLKVALWLKKIEDDKS